MEIEELKIGQTVWVKGYVDRNVFRDCGGFIINSGNSVSKYVRLKDGKLTEHHA